MKVLKRLRWTDNGGEVKGLSHNKWGWWDNIYMFIVYNFIPPTTTFELNGVEL